MSDNTGKIIDDLVNLSLAASREMIGETHACNCMGPQRGETLCPCALRSKHAAEHKMLTDGILIGGKRYTLVPSPASKGEGE